MIIYPSATCAGGGFSSHHLPQIRTSLAVVVVTPVLCTGVVFYLCHGNKLILEIRFCLQLYVVSTLYETQLHSLLNVGRSICNSKINVITYVQ